MNPDESWNHFRALNHNRKAWDRLAARGDRLTKTARPEDLENPLETVDAAGWLGGNIYGKRVLCLAAGGGRQGPIYAKAGAVVTVVDLSPAMLRQDQQVAREQDLKIETLETTMEDLSPLANELFDIVIHPVSTCYIPDPRPVFQEVARVLKPEGLYISQHKQPISMQASLRPSEYDQSYIVQESYYRTTPLSVSPKPNLIREDGTLEWIHRWEVLIGGICAAGMVVEDLAEPYHAQPEAAPGTFGHRSNFVAPYVRIKARKSKTPGESSGATLILDNGSH